MALDNYFKLYPYSLIYDRCRIEIYIFIDMHLSEKDACMIRIEKIDAIAEECLSLDSLIQEYGTGAMRDIMRIMLFEVAEEIARLQIDLQVSLGAE